MTSLNAARPRARSSHGRCPHAGTLRAVDVTTVAADLIVVHAGAVVHRRDHLRADTDHRIAGRTVRTAAAPRGALLSRIATVNDLHFGEVDCGRLEQLDLGPIQRVEPGEAPYPWTMNAGAVAEIVSVAPDLVVVKGDVTTDGLDEEWAAFHECYGPVSDRLLTVRGNHDAQHDGQIEAAGDRYVNLPGVSVVLLDTVAPGRANGVLDADQLERLDEHARTADRPVLVMGHHPQWLEGPRSDDHFGLHPDSSEALSEVVARRRSIVAYTAGHTHRHRVLPMPCGAPSIEVGCVKDFPGTWAEYRVHEGAIVQVVHRISTPEALRWSERCRHLYRDFGVDYETYALGCLEDRCFTIEVR